MRVWLICVLAAVAALAAGCKAKEEKQLRILCGSSMREPVEEIVRQDEAEGRGRALLDFGGSETLLPRILAGEQGDVFVCHDPFEQQVKDAGKWAGSATVGMMRPVILVKKGNPKAIRSVADLARADVRTGIGRPDVSTCGQMFVEMLRKRGLYDKVVPRSEQFRTHAELANGLTKGPLDAVIVWNWVSVMYKDEVEIVGDDLKYEPVRVTIVGLKGAANPKLRDEFLERCRGEAVKKVFERYGYTAK